MSTINSDSTDHKPVAPAGANDSSPITEPDSRKPRSGGPRTAAGKLRSRMNGFKHGKYAKHPVLRTESEVAYHLLLDEYLTQFTPATEFARRLVQQLASVDWRLARLVNVESHAIDSNLDAIEQNPFTPQPESQLHLTTAAINAALNQPALSYSAHREVALVRVRESILRTLLSLRRHQPVNPTPSYLVLPAEAGEEEPTTKLVDSVQAQPGPNSDRTGTGQHTELRTELMTELESEQPAEQ